MEKKQYIAPLTEIIQTETESQLLHLSMAKTTDYKGDAISGGPEIILKPETPAAVGAKGNGLWDDDEEEDW